MNSTRHRAAILVACTLALSLSAGCGKEEKAATVITAPPVLVDTVSAHDLVDRIVAALDQDVGLQGLEQGDGGVVREDDHHVHHAERR